MLDWIGLNSLLINFILKNKIKKIFRRRVLKMRSKTLKKILIIFVVSCLILGMNVLPVNADSHQPSIPTQLPAPPDGFNPLVATAADLAKYGFPSRPVDPVALAQWEYVMSNAKYYGKPVQTPSTVTSNGLEQPIDYNLLWAGYATTSSNNNGATYSQTSAEWTQPNYLDYWYGDPILWTGMGGINTEYIVQAGTQCNGTYYHAPAKNIFFVQDFNNNWEWESYPVIAPGDLIWVDVTYGGEVSTAYLEDISNKEYTSVQFFTGYYDGTSAEYIWEDVAHLDAPNTSGTFANCYSIGTNGMTYLYNANYTECIITSDGTSTGAQWAWPTGLPNTSSGFTINTNP
jgi:hypothetical protein